MAKRDKLLGVISLLLSHMQSIEWYLGRNSEFPERNCLRSYFFYLLRNQMGKCGFPEAFFLPQDFLIHCRMNKGKGGNMTLTFAARVDPSVGGSGSYSRQSRH